MVLHWGPLFWAAAAKTMPAARTLFTGVSKIFGSVHPSEVGQLQELLIASGARSGLGFWRLRSQGAIMKSMHSV